MLKLNEFSHNHHLSKAKMLAKISDVEFRYKKMQTLQSVFHFNSGEWIRTTDLRVMSPSKVSTNRTYSALR